jgi:soluble lytic murein transglycosylase
VSRWLDQRPVLELDEFVEEIPIEETRGYVKRVLRSYAAYRLLYGGDGQSAALFLSGPAQRKG